MARRASGLDCAGWRKSAAQGYVLAKEALGRLGVPHD
jgi:hypothetical protein